MNKYKNVLFALILILLIACVVKFFAPEKTVLKPPYPEGVYTAGRDIPEGEYLILSDGTGKFNLGSPQNESSMGRGAEFKRRKYVTLNKWDILTVENGTIYPIEMAPEFKYQGSTLKGGEYRAGMEIPAGEYYVVNNQANYYEKPIPYYITVLDGEYLTLIPSETAYLLTDNTLSPVNLDGMLYGMYKVGRDIPEGIYSVEWIKGSGTYSVMNSSHNYGEEIVEQCTIYTPDKRVELKNGQYIRIFNLSIKKISDLNKE